MSTDETHMYEMCKEMCKEMSETILGRLERFDAFDTKFQSVLSVQTDLQNHVVNQEQMTSALDERVEVLETKCEDLAKYASQLQAKLLDLETRPAEIVGKQHFPHPVKVDRAHRSLQPKSAAGGKQGTIMARICHFQEQILRLSRAQSMEYKGNKVLIFPDYTSEVMDQRRAFRDVMKALRDGGVKHHLRYPARFHIYWGGQDTRQVRGTRK
ncbi:hypothetical protein DPEC_G00002330 [Dallia pectoralis]|uniref:Uncharacterized protein n=1 Tax=Dallia pectoralis TaxID=75939 RepID=A0ACC2HJW7_DALPE|nr:hypothetical protein DPEC_G00002330 [Dallia pectoralis]